MSDGLKEAQLRAQGALGWRARLRTGAYRVPGRWGIGALRRFIPLLAFCVVNQHTLAEARGSEESSSAERHDKEQRVLVRCWVPAVSQARRNGASRATSCGAIGARERVQGQKQFPGVCHYGRPFQPA